MAEQKHPHALQKVGGRFQFLGNEPIDRGIDPRRECIEGVLHHRTHSRCLPNIQAAVAMAGEATGSRTVKIDPRPGSLSTSKSPFSNCASLWLTARPSPDPPYDFV